VHHGEVLRILDRLEPSPDVTRQRAVSLTDLADVLRDHGRYPEARRAYVAALEIKLQQGNLLGQGVSLGQLGTLAMLEGNLEEAAERYRAALTLFQQLREPAAEATAWHQLGMVYERARQWDEAERHYRESARIEQSRGDFAAAAVTWNQLGIVNRLAGRPEAAERWYRGAIAAFRQVGNNQLTAGTLANLANLLRSQPKRLAEARRLAEEALALKRTLDPGAAETWQTYNILADIAAQQGERAPAREYRRLAREVKRNFAGTRQELRKHAPLILSAVAAVSQPRLRAQFETALPQLEQRGWTNLVAAIRRILAGERDVDDLCEPLDLEDSMIVDAILRGLDDPSTLQELQADATKKLGGPEGPFPLPDPSLRSG
jgi:tetratricopeptide (TPR) repeat protein